MEGLLVPISRRRTTKLILRIALKQLPRSQSRWRTLVIAQCMASSLARKRSVMNGLPRSRKPSTHSLLWHCSRLGLVGSSTHHGEHRREYMHNSVTGSNAEQVVTSQVQHNSNNTAFFINSIVPVCSEGKIFHVRLIACRYSSIARIIVTHFDCVGICYRYYDGQNFDHQAI